MTPPVSALAIPKYPADFIADNVQNRPALAITIFNTLDRKMRLSVFVD